MYRTGDKIEIIQTGEIVEVLESLGTSPPIVKVLHTRGEEQIEYEYLEEHVSPLGLSYPENLEDAEEDG